MGIVRKIWNQDNAMANFVRTQRKESKMTQLALFDLTGIGLCFVHDFEQGKPNLMTDKVNQILLFFDHQLVPTPILDKTRKELDT